MIFSFLNKYLSNKGLDKHFPLFHKLYIYLYQKTQKPKKTTISIPLKCKLIYQPKLGGIGFYLQNFNQFEPQTTQIFLKYIKQGNTIIDIGANIGYYSILAAKKTGPKGRVMAIEPEPKNISQLKSNITLNKLTNITVIHQAISDKTDKTKLYLSPISSGEHSIITKTKQFITVSTTTLDNLVKTYKLTPNLIKVDTEGAEHQILENSIQTLKKYHPILIFEYSTRTDNRIFNLNQLLELKYKIFEINERQNKVQFITTQQINQKLKTKSYLNLLAQ